MYQNIYYDKFDDKIHLWDDEYGYNVLDYQKYAYKLDPDGDYVALDGNRLSKVLDWDYDEHVNGLVYEGGVRPEMRVLVDVYLDSDEPSKDHNICFIDIEVAKEDKYSDPMDADNTITSISYYFSNTKQMICLILDKKGTADFSGIEGARVEVFPTEKRMLDYFIKEWGVNAPTIVTGWNVKWYDMMYLFQRYNKVYPTKMGYRLSPIGKISQYRDRRGNEHFKIAGVSILDYMELYKTFTYNEEPSYTLDFISKKVLKRGKVEYEKDLDHLYEIDPEKFVEYNIEDVQLIIDMDKKLDFISIARGTAHVGHVPYEDVFLTSRYMEGACLTSLKRQGLVATHSKRADGEKAAGAFVKKTTAGRYNWVYDLDLTSLYPSIIMTLNISPETKLFKILDWDVHQYHDAEKDVYETVHFVGNDREELEMSRQQLKKLLESGNVTVSKNGVVYRKDKSGLIPSLLREWFDQRAKFRKISDEAHENGDYEKSTFYDRKQKIQKVLLNSLYGVLLLPNWRFYDKDNGEAVTLTGQDIIHFTTDMANLFYNRELGTDKIDYCIYTDTDSVFYESMPIIEHRYGKVNEEDIPDLTIKIASEVQDHINMGYDMYAVKFLFTRAHRLNIKQELVARRAFWGSAKKRYAMWIVRDGNKVVDEPDIKGFDNVRSSFPKLYRKFLEEIIIDILHDIEKQELNSKVIEFKKGLSSYPVADIMNPTSVKNITKYLPEDKDKLDMLYIKGTPIHVKSAVHYNHLLTIKKMDQYRKLADGDKILWTYLMDNPHGFDTIALAGFDDPPELEEFVDKYIYRDKMFDRAMQKKLQSIWDDLGWGKINLNPAVQKFVTYE